MQENDMTTSEVADVIKAIASTSSKNEKQNIVREYIKDKTFRRVLLAALNQYITYGVKKAPPLNFAEMGTDEFTEKTWQVFDELATRKLTGNAARQAINDAMLPLNEKSRSLFANILERDFRAGFSESTVNKVEKNLIPTFDCMLAHKFSEHKHKLKYPLVGEPKLDGVRVLAFVSILKGTVTFVSRSGHEYFNFDHLKSDLLEVASSYRNELMRRACDEYDTLGLPDGEETDTAVLDELFAKHKVDSFCEFVVDGEVISGIFNKTVSEVRKKGEQAKDAKFAIFDILPAEMFEPTFDGNVAIGGTYLERRKTLEDFTGCDTTDSNKVVLLPMFWLNNEEEVHALYEKVRERNIEGLIVKDPNGFYYLGRNWAWTKIKAEESVDVSIVDAVEGTGKYVGMLGALIVDYKGAFVNVGSGLSDEQRNTFWEAYLRDKETGGNEFLHRMVEVQYHEETPDGSLRHPRFKRFRDDLPKKD